MAQEQREGRRCGDHEPVAGTQRQTLRHAARADVCQWRETGRRSGTSRGRPGPWRGARTASRRVNTREGTLNMRALHALKILSCTAALAISAAGAADKSPATAPGSEA